jgi:hypothetical protein
VTHTKGKGPALPPRTPAPEAEHSSANGLLLKTSTPKIQASFDPAIALLGGAVRVRTRVRGFAPWNPQAATLRLLEQVRAVLGEYEDYLPLTIRQIFYRLVGVHEYDKTEQAYDRLCEHLNRARRARRISMDVIRDDGGVITAPDDWKSAEQFWRVVRGMAEHFTLDHSAGQKTRLVVICEAAGMVPQLARVANPFGVTVMSGGGFDSLTDKHKFAAALAEHGRPTVVLHIGDHDPSGVSMFLSFLEDVKAFTREPVCSAGLQITRMRCATPSHRCRKRSTTGVPTIGVCSSLSPTWQVVNGATRPALPPPSSKALRTRPASVSASSPTSSGSPTRRSNSVAIACFRLRWSTGSRKTLNNHGASGTGARG